jgi:hypothetical protein
MSQKTVLELDLVGYSDVARNLEQQVGVEVVARFNDQIQEFVDVGLAAIQSNREDVVRATTGDGAILVLKEQLVLTRSPWRCLRPRKLTTHKRACRRPSGGFV